MRPSEVLCTSVVIAVPPLRGLFCACERSARLFEIDDFASEVQVAAERLEAFRRRRSHRLHRSNRPCDQMLDRPGGDVVIGRVEQRRPRVAVGACGERLGGERAERLDVASAGRKQSGEIAPEDWSSGRRAERSAARVEATGFEGSTTTCPRAAVPAEGSPLAGRRATGKHDRVG